MKVLLLTGACDKEDVSEPEIVSKWVEEISKDHEVTVFAYSRRERFGCVQEQFGHLNVIEWRDIWFPKRMDKFRAVVKPGYFLFYFKARSFLKKLLRKEKFDVIHQVAPLAWRYPSPAAGLGVPFIRGPVEGGLSTPEGLSKSTGEAEPKYYKLRNLDQWFWRYSKPLRRTFLEADKVMLAAPYVGDVIGISGASNVIVEPDHGLTDRQKIPQKIYDFEGREKLIFLFVGRIIRTKGIRDAVRAVKRLPTDIRKKVEFVVVGDGPDLQACKDEAEKLEVLDVVKFLGWQTREEVDQWYKEADVFLFPSYREPTGGVLLEAMSFSLPVITCAYGGPDFLIDETSGIKISPDSEEQYSSDIAEAITTLVTDKTKLQSLSEGSWKRANGFFDWSTKRKRLTAIYKSVAKD